jgi:hypothetical protein
MIMTTIYPHVSNLDRTIGLAGREENVYPGPERQGDAWFIMGPLVDSGPNLEERVIVPAEIIITCTFCTNIQCGSGTDFSNKRSRVPAGRVKTNKQTNIMTTRRPLPMTSTAAVIATQHAT